MGILKALFRLSYPIFDFQPIKSEILPYFWHLSVTGEIKSAFIELKSVVTVRYRLILPFYEVWAS